MNYKNFIIEAFEAAVVKPDDKPRVCQFKVRVMASPQGEMKVEEATPVEYETKKMADSIKLLEARGLKGPDLVALGRTLAAILLPPGKTEQPPGVRELLARSLNNLGPDDGLRLQVRLPPLLAAVPWEYLYVERAGGGDGVDGFLALDPRVAMVRYEALPVPHDLQPFAGDIKVVAALAAWEDLDGLDLKKEKADLERIFAGQASIQAEFLESATLDKVQTAVEKGAQIFHFAGHGLFDRKQSDLPGLYSGTGSLALADQLVEAEDIAVNLRGNGVRLAVLGGCETGRRDGIYVWSGIAPALIKAQIPAVVANQLKIADEAAIAFSEHFYRALVGGLSVERAVTAGRIAAYNKDKKAHDWGVPVLYLRAADGQLFAGAAKSAVRQQAQEKAQVSLKVRLKAVEKGGKVLGPEVGTMLSGKLLQDVRVAGDVYGELSGPIIDTLRRGTVNVTIEAETLKKGGKIEGPKIINLGG